MSLIENFKDRVPTEVLGNGAIRWEKFDEEGNSLGYVYLKRADEPTEVGDIWNKVTYDGLKDAILDRLKIEDKASTQEAQGGIDDTKYMTPKKVSEYLDYARGVQYTGIVLADSTNTINLNPYLSSNVKRLDMIINCIFHSSYRAVELTGNNIVVNDGGKSEGASSRKIGGINYVRSIITRISILPDIHAYEVIGSGISYSSSSGGTGTSVQFNESGTFETITSIVTGARRPYSQSTDMNYPIQLGIYQYLK